MQYGIPSSLVNGTAPNAHEFTIDLICPELTTPEVDQALKQKRDDIKKEDIIVTLDTRGLPQRFLLENNMDEQNSAALGNLNVNGGPGGIYESSVPQTKGGKPEDGENNPMIKVKSPDERLDDDMGNDEPTEDRLLDKQAGRFRKAMIKVELDQDLEFQDVRLRILRFVEIDPETLKSEAVSGELL